MKKTVNYTKQSLVAKIIVRDFFLPVRATHLNFLLAPSYYLNALPIRKRTTIIWQKKDIANGEKILSHMRTRL